MLDSLVVEHGLRTRGLQHLQPVDLVALQHVRSSRTRDQTHVPHFGRKILSHWTTREALVEEVDRVL